MWFTSPGLRPELFVYDGFIDTEEITVEIGLACNLFPSRSSLASERGERAASRSSGGRCDAYHPNSHGSLPHALPLTTVPSMSHPTVRFGCIVVSALSRPEVITSGTLPPCVKALGLASPPPPTIRPIASRCVAGPPLGVPAWLGTCWGDSRR